MAAESHSLSINPNAETKWILLCINTIRPEECPSCTPASGGMAGLQTEVAQLQNGDVVRAAGRGGAWAAGANIWF